MNCLLLGEPNEKPAIKAGIYKDLGKFWPSIERHRNCQTKYFKRRFNKHYHQIIYCGTILEHPTLLLLELKSGIFLIIMLFFLLTESLLGLLLNFLTKSKSNEF